MYVYLYSAIILDTKTRFNTIDISGVHYDTETC